MRCRACNTVWLVSGGGDDRRAAVARRGADRERRDLFASRPPDEGIVRETMRPPPGVGARNETSVLFKLDELPGTGRMKTEPPPPSVAPTGAASNDHSGVIDLNALAASVAPRRPAAATAAAAPMLFGASDPPPAAFARELAVSASSYPQPMPPAPMKRSRMRTLGGLLAGAAVVAACGVGVFIAFGGENPAPKAASAPPAPPLPAAAPATVAAPTPAAPEASSKAADDDKKTASNAGKKRAKGAKASKHAGRAQMTSSAPPPPPKPVKAADPCHCHGDFNCIIACTAAGKN